METKEKRNDEHGFSEKMGNMSCCDEKGDTGEMSDCCKSIGETDDCHSMMSKCMEGCRWFPLMPLIIGIGLFALGYFLDAEVVRVLWMVLSGIVVLAGILCFIAMNVISRK